MQLQEWKIRNWKGKDTRQRNKKDKREEREKEEKKQKVDLG